MNLYFVSITRVRCTPGYSALTSLSSWCGGIFPGFKGNLGSKIPHSNSYEYCGLRSYNIFRGYVPLGRSSSYLKRPICWALLASGPKTYKSRSGAAARDIGKDDSDSEDDSRSDSEDELPALEHSRYEVAGLPTNYKIVKHHLNSLRVDAVLGAGLNVSRRKIEDEFLGSKLLLNGEKILKKSLQVKEGDTIDLIMERKDSILKIKRVKVLHLDENRAATGRITVLLQAWRAAFEHSSC